MNPILRNVLAVVAGFIAGIILNGALISISGKVITPPEGVDVTSVEGLKAGIHLFEPKHFIFPFLAHALGTLLAAFVTTKIAVGNRLRAALIVGGVFLMAGISNCFVLPAPVWFMVVDLVFAYLPMAYLGWKLAGSNK